MTAPVEVYRRRIEEIVVEGKRIGRHVHHDPRSLAYQVAADGSVATKRWDREIPVLDQGQVGSCTGNAATGHVGTTPCFTDLPASHPTLNEDEADVLYSAAEVIDGDGPYPPNDNGSSGLSVAKAAKNAGLISGYQHMTSTAACQTAIQTGPFIVGSNWYTGMDNPDGNGLVEATGTVRGGHEYECIGYDASTDLFEFVNSWGTSYGVEGHFFYSSATLTKLLSEEGDATQFVPLSVPAPTPTPTPTPPGPPPFPGPTPVPPGPAPTPTPPAAPDLSVALWAEVRKFATAHHVEPLIKNAANALTEAALAAGYPVSGAHEAH